MGTRPLDSDGSASSLSRGFNIDLHTPQASSQKIHAVCVSSLTLKDEEILSYNLKKIIFVISFVGCPEPSSRSSTPLHVTVQEQEIFWPCKGYFAQICPKNFNATNFAFINFL